MNNKSEQELIHLEHEFFTDNSYIYYKNFIIGGIVAENTYVLHPSYVADDLYFCYCSTLESGKLLAVYFKADFNSFDVFDENPSFSEDRYTVYFKGQPLIDFDISSSFYLGEDYIKDAKSVYYGNIHMPLANPVTFTLLGEGYATDGDYSFYNGLLLNTAEIISVLGNSYATDGLKFWKAGLELEKPHDDEYIKDILGKF